MTLKIALVFSFLTSWLVGFPLIFSIGVVMAENSLTTASGDLVQQLLSLSSANIQKSQNERSLSVETIPPFWIPDGCEYFYDYNTQAGDFLDVVVCSDWCGEGDHFIITITSSFDAAGDLESVADCRLPKCRTCSEDIGACPCPVIANLYEVCQAMCDTEDTIDMWEGVVHITTGSDVPSMVPSDAPSMVPSDVPSSMPMDIQSMIPSDIPSMVLLR